ncbi:MAG: IS66 family transposase [Candidatus Omnitrophica bacterium]|nr:IS66 family transposase [Candidatus Omnitrophota bacterium]
MSQANKYLKIIADLSVENKELRKIIAQQKETIELQAKRISELEARIAEFTAYPSTPSGMKPVYEKEPAKSRRKKPGQKQDHHGHRRATPDRIDKEKDWTLCKCPDCGSDLGEPVEIRKRYTEDIPTVEVEVIQHNIHRYYCSNCKKIIEPKVTDALPKAQLGLRLSVMTAWLHYNLGVTIENIIKWLSCFSSLKISSGGLTQSWARISVILLPVYQELAKEARASAVLNADETGWRVNGKTYWLWCFTNELLAYFTIDRSRGSPVIKKVLGKVFGGILICDFFGAYGKIVAWAKQRCIVHLFRELEKVSTKNNSFEWVGFTKKLKRLLKDAMRLSARQKEIEPTAYMSKSDRLHQRLAMIYNQKYEDADYNRIANRLKKHKDELFTFVIHSEVSADNNHAERQIRPAVIMRKNSYCNRSQQGADTQAILMSIFRTLHLRKVDPISTLTNSLSEWIKTGTISPLPSVSLQMAK